ncbi:cytochrome c oxidase subunit NDUFA4-like isoform X1 [Penaeus chinensis]|uniref:cytochrome c oxidase subunit NDUFA4-like isoform X1 n=1 Tax=Penaeus chinensis TaxID=139456 RepID=UPI001FB66240|nr:cytochrome c oxidase subunit NDUFA4-like isoform X1 [Penaeus chinensis]
MQGLTLASLKKHPALIPLYVCLGAGVAGATFYTLRLAFRNPDVSWNRTGNPEPQQEWANKQYKVRNTKSFYLNIFVLGFWYLLIGLLYLRINNHLSVPCVYRKQSLFGNLVKSTKQFSLMDRA